MNIYKYLWFFGTKPKDSTARLMPSGKSVHVAKNTTLLNAALEDGMTGHTIANLVLVVSVNVNWLREKLNQW